MLVTKKKTTRGTPQVGVIYGRSSWMESWKVSGRRACANKRCHICHGEGKDIKDVQFHKPLSPKLTGVTTGYSTVATRIRKLGLMSDNNYTTTIAMVALFTSSNIRTTSSNNKYVALTLSQKTNNARLVVEIVHLIMKKRNLQENTIYNRHYGNRSGET